MIYVPQGIVDLIGAQAAATLVTLASSVSEDPIATMSDAFGLDQDAALDRLDSDDRRFRQVAGFGLIRQALDMQLVQISDAVKALSDGRITFEKVASSKAPALDARTEEWTRVVRCAALSDGGCHFIYRAAKRGCAEDVGSLRSVGGRLGSKSLVVVASTSGLDLRGAAVLVVFAAALQFRAPAIVLTCSQEVIFDQLEDYDDGGFIGPEDERPKPPACRATVRSVPRQLFDATPHVHVWKAPFDIELANTDHPFIGAFGPAELDLRSALADLRDQAPRDFDDRSLKALLGTFGSVDQAARVIACATRIAGRLRAPPADLATRLALSLRTHVVEPTFARAEVAFDKGLINADRDVERLLARAEPLSQSGARILFHGVPGGGKSILAGALAHAMGRRVRSVRGGDVYFSKWGATERAIWAILEDAQRKGEVVVLEEAESIVGTRSEYTSSTNRHLTVTATNEWLAALDQHPDPVLATTNFVTDIDPAIRRRFHVLVELLPMRPEQELYAWAQIFRLDPPPSWPCRGVSVVADFTAAADRMRLFGDSGAEAAAAALDAAIEARTGVGSKNSQIGFLRGRF